MKEPAAAILFLLQAIPSILSQSSTTTPFEKQVIAGIYKTEIPSPSTFYSTVAPLIYEFKIPKWDPMDFNVNINEHNCTSPNYMPNSICFIRFYFSEVSSRFSGYLFDSQPLVNTFGLMNASPQISDIQFECDLLAQHFRDLYIHPDVLERYLAKLKKCSPISDSEFYRKVPNYNYNISDVYQKMTRAFSSEVWAKIHTERVDAGLWANALNSLNSLAFSNYYIEANRWKLALGDCQASRIPSTLLPPSLLADSLQDMFAIFGENETGLVPVISPSDVGNYYDAPLADCTYTNETFVVRILVPAVPSHQSYSLFELKTAKFFDTKYRRICRVELPNAYVLFDNMEKVAYETRCRPNEMCHVPSVKFEGKISPCASAYLNKHYFNVVKYCRLVCEDISPYHLGGDLKLATPSAQLVESDKFILTGSGRSSQRISNDVTIRCPGWPDKTVKLAEFGALEITLPCICRLYTNAPKTGLDKGLAPRTPCDESLTAVPKIVHVIPFHWMNSLKLKELRAKQVSQAAAAVYIFTDRDVQVKLSNNPMLINDEDKEQNTMTTSGGTVFVLVFYFLLIVLMFLMILFLMHRLRSMGVTVNPLKVVRGTDSVSYANINKSNENGLLFGESSNCPGRDAGQLVHL